MSSFEIPDAPASIALKRTTVGDKAVAVATALFTVNNKSGQQLSARLKVMPQGDAKAEWFEVQGEKERPFATAESHKITVSIAVPDEGAAGEAKFRLQALNVNDPGNDYAESAVVTMTMPAKENAKTNWVLIIGAVAGVLLLVVGGFAAWWLWPRGAGDPETREIAALKNTTLEEAKATLEADGFVVDTQEDTTELLVEPGRIAKQDPPPGPAQVGATVTLYIAKGEFIPREAINKSQDAARLILEAKKFVVAPEARPAPATTGQDPGFVIGTDPPADETRHAIGSTVTLVTDPGVMIPDVTRNNRVNLSTATSQLASAGLGVGEIRLIPEPGGGPFNVVLAQAPLPGGPVKKQNVTLTVRVEDRCANNPRAHGCRPPICLTHPALCLIERHGILEHLPIHP